MLFGLKVTVGCVVFMHCYTNDTGQWTFFPVKLQQMWSFLNMLHPYNTILMNSCKFANLCPLLIIQQSKQCCSGSAWVTLTPVREGCGWGNQRGVCCSWRESLSLSPLHSSCTLLGNSLAADIISLRPESERISFYPSSLLLLLSLSLPPGRSVSCLHSFRTPLPVALIEHRTHTPARAHSRTVCPVKLSGGSTLRVCEAERSRG